MYKKTTGPKTNITGANLDSSSGILNRISCMELYANTIDFLYSKVKPTSLSLLDSTVIYYLNSYV